MYACDSTGLHLFATHRLFYMGRVAACPNNLAVFPPTCCRAGQTLCPPPTSIAALLLASTTWPLLNPTQPACPETACLNCCLPTRNSPCSMPKQPARPLHTSCLLGCLQARGVLARTLVLCGWLRAHAVVPTRSTVRGWVLLVGSSVAGNLQSAWRFVGASGAYGVMPCNSKQLQTAIHGVGPCGASAGVGHAHTL